MAASAVSNSANCAAIGDRAGAAGSGSGCCSTATAGAGTGFAIAAAHESGMPVLKLTMDEARASGSLGELAARNRWASESMARQASVCKKAIFAGIGTAMSAVLRWK